MSGPADAAKPTVGAPASPVIQMSVTPPAPVAPTLAMSVTPPTLARAKNPNIDAALGPEHETEAQTTEGLPVPGTGARRGSVASAGSKGSRKSFAESIMTVLSTSGRVIKKGVHKAGKAIEEGLAAPYKYLDDLPPEEAAAAASAIRPF